VHIQELQKAKESNQQLFGLIDAMGQITGILDRKNMLSMVIEHASRLVNADRSTTYILDPNTHETIYNLSYQYQPDSEKRVIALRSAPHQSPFNFLTSQAVSVPYTSSGITELGDSAASNTLGGLMVLNKRSGKFEEEDARVLKILADHASSLLQIAELYESSEELFMDTIRALVAAVDAKDTSTQGHSLRVSDYSVLIAQELDLTPAQINELRISSMLHDLGKIGIPEAILNKQDSLTDEEYDYIKQHPTIGAGILGKVKLFSAISPGILEHHERLDGSGYPSALRGDQISLMGRVIMVADVFDAMTSHRPYRDALSVEETLSYLQANSGKLFDALCVESLVRIVSRSK
jgi:HD-GYP domain-containing protein (c-di-GMP phosphodiesterase class II)